MLCVGGVIMWKASDTIVQRFTKAPEESANVRVVLAQAAVKMANDKRLGVGLNNFGLKINPPYTYGSHIGMKEDEKGGLVETVYLMIAAEAGWHTLGIYLLFIITAIFHSAVSTFKSWKTPTFPLSLGMTCGLTIIALQSTLEWVLKQTNNFYQLVFIIACIYSLKLFIKENDKSLKYNY